MDQQGLNVLLPHFPQLVHSLQRDQETQLVQKVLQVLFPLSHQMFLQVQLSL